MPRYFFSVHDGVERLDREGTEFSDVRAARSEAIRAAGEILRDEDGRLVGKSWAMDVTDETGRSVLTIKFEAEAHD